MLLILGVLDGELLMLVSFLGCYAVWMKRRQRHPYPNGVTAQEQNR
jgi:uncharacterized Tic20 family protein